MTRGAASGRIGDDGGGGESGGWSGRCDGSIGDANSGGDSSGASGGVDGGRGGGGPAPAQFYWIPRAEIWDDTQLVLCLLVARRQPPDSQRDVQRTCFLSLSELFS